jgi:hypothetical protein
MSSRTHLFSGLRPLGVDEAEAIADLARRCWLGARAGASPVVGIESAASAARVEIRHADLGVQTGGCEAVLAPRSDDRFVILVDPTPRDGWGSITAPLRREIARHRIRFRVAHELGHTLFYSRHPGQTPVRFRERAPDEERFCDRFASALLLPDDVLRAGPSAMQLVQAHRRYDVSLEVATRAWVRVHKRGAALFYWPPGDHRPRIQWAGRVSRKLAASWRGVLQGQDPFLARFGGELALVRERHQALVIEAI